MIVVAAVGLAGLAGFAIGLLTIKRSGTWCPQCGDPKRCLRHSRQGADGTQAPL